MCKVLYNNELNGLELYFDNKPQPQILEKLKSLFFKWHTAKKCWYAKITDERKALAEKLSNGEQITEPTTKAPPQVQAKPQYQYNYCYNGIKDKDGKLFKASYDFNKVDLSIKVTGDSYRRLPQINGAEHQNDTDSMTDYYDYDRYIITPLHPDFLGVLAAYNKQTEHDAKVYERRNGELLEVKSDILEALRLAEQLAKENNKQITANTITARKQANTDERKQIERNSNIKMAKNWLENASPYQQGKAFQSGDWCIYTEEHRYAILFEATSKVSYDLIVISLITGERHEASGEYDSEQERQNAINKLNK